MKRNLELRRREVETIVALPVGGVVSPDLKSVRVGSPGAELDLLTELALGLELVPTLGAGLRDRVAHIFRPVLSAGMAIGEA
jgi:hypothetical protein